MPSVATQSPTTVPPGAAGPPPAAPSTEEHQACTAALLRLLLSPQQVDRLQLPAPIAALLVDPFASLDATAELARYSLASPGTAGTVSVHRLVQAVTLDQLTKEDRSTWRSAAATLVTAALPDQPCYREHWPTFAQLLPHARAALDLASPAIARLADRSCDRS